MIIFRIQNTEDLETDSCKNTAAAYEKWSFKILSWTVL